MWNATHGKGHTLEGERLDASARPSWQRAPRGLPDAHPCRTTHGRDCSRAVLRALRVGPRSGGADPAPALIAAPEAPCASLSRARAPGTPVPRTLS